MELSWLNITIPTPGPGKLWTGIFKVYFPLKLADNSPDPGTKKSVQL